MVDYIIDLVYLPGLSSIRGIGVRAMMSMGLTGLLRSRGLSSEVEISFFGFYYSLDL